MTMLDANGRLFGRLNIVDAVVVIFLLGLIPVAYGSYLLFRPPAPRIDSVTRVEITGEERRVTAGNTLSAKLKVTGAGFNPMMRAEIGGVPALGFVFENPNSADIIVGKVPTGTHDLVLMDGVNEVARARNAVEIHSERVSMIRGVGTLVNMPLPNAEGLAAGTTLTGGNRIVALGPVQPARLRVAMGTSSADLPILERFERSAVIDLACDPGLRDEPCGISGRYLDSDRPVSVVLPSGYVFAIDEVLPQTPPTPAEITLRLTGGGELDLVAVGDRDAFLDPRAATIRAVGPRTTRAGYTSITIALAAGLDRTEGGWTYRGGPVRPGEQFRLDTGRYVARGVIEAVKPSPGEPKP